MLTRLRVGAFGFGFSAGRLRYSDTSRDGACWMDGRNFFVVTLRGDKAYRAFQRRLGNAHAVRASPAPSGYRRGSAQSAQQAPRLCYQRLG